MWSKKQKLYLFQRIILSFKKKKKIFCLFGVVKEFEWESPSYTLSLALLIICAGAAASIGYFSKYQSKWHGFLLMLIFLITGIIQFITNSQFRNEIFPDEGFGHDDKHHLSGIEKLFQFTKS